MVRLVFHPTRSTELFILAIGNNELKVDNGVNNPIFIGGEGRDGFVLNLNVKGVTHFSDFNWEEDQIVVLPGDFPNATPEDFTIVGGTLFYQDQPLVSISNKIHGEEKAYSYYSAFYWINLLLMPLRVIQADTSSPAIPGKSRENLS